MAGLNCQVNSNGVGAYHTRKFNKYIKTQRNLYNHFITLYVAVHAKIKITNKQHTDAILNNGTCCTFNTSGIKNKTREAMAKMIVAFSLLLFNIVIQKKELNFVKPKNQLKCHRI